MRLNRSSLGFVFLFVIAAALTAVIIAYFYQAHAPSIIGFNPANGSRLAGREVAFHAEARGWNREPVRYDWVFGDGGSSSEQSPVHRYSKAGDFSVVLTVSGSTDGKRSVRFQIHLNESPRAVATANPTSGAVPLSVQFDGSGSIDPDASGKQVLQYHWSFGDGGASNLPKPVHVYEKAGEYTAILNIEDTDGATDQAQIAITVSIRRNQAPVARFAPSALRGFVGGEISFNGTSSEDPDGQITSYEWDFGDESPVDTRGPFVSHRFSQAGQYRVKLTVIDSGHAQDSAVQVIEIAEPRPPVAMFTFSPTRPEAGQNVRFDASSSTAPDGQITKFAWHIDGDAKPDKITTVPRLDYAFPISGHYRITLTVFDNRGKFNSFTYPVEVARIPAPPEVTVFVSGGIGLTEQFSIYKGAIGFPLWGSIAGELSYGYGEGQLSKGGYPVTLKMTGVDFNVLYAVTPAIFIGPGIGVLVLNGEYQIDWPVIGDKSFTQYVPVLNLMVGYKISFLMLSAGVSYPVLQK